MTTTNALTLANGDASRTVDIREGNVGEPDLQVRADARTWLDFLAGVLGYDCGATLYRVRMSN